MFSGVVSANQIWKPDPFDVETIHHEARAAFSQLLNRAAGSDPPPHGKSLLLLGEAGSGNTHLIRAFRLASPAAGTVCATSRTSRTSMPPYVSNCTALPIRATTGSAGALFPY